MSYPYSSVEARVFVRNTTGNLIVPEQPKDSIEQLSLAIPLRDVEKPFPQLTELQQDKDVGIDFFHIQHYLGPDTGMVTIGERWETPFAHGYLAQSYSPNIPDGHMELSIEEAKDITKNPSAIDLLDRHLASRAFNVMTHGQIQPPPMSKEAPAAPSRDRLARDTMRESAIFGKALETAFGDQPMSPEDYKKLMQKYGSLVHSARMLLDHINRDSRDNA